MSEEPTIVTFDRDGRVSIATPGAFEELRNATLALHYLAGLTSLRPRPIIVKDAEDRK